MHTHACIRVGMEQLYSKVVSIEPQNEDISQHIITLPASLAKQMHCKV